MKSAAARILRPLRARGNPQKKTPPGGDPSGVKGRTAR
jgi:hypothetical protein